MRRVFECSVPGSAARNRDESAPPALRSQIWIRAWPETKKALRDNTVTQKYQDRLIGSSPFDWVTGQGMDMARYCQGIFDIKYCYNPGEPQARRVATPDVVTGEGLASPAYGGHRPPCAAPPRSWGGEPIELA
jgi:hypothetical protein